MWKTRRGRVLGTIAALIVVAGLGFSSLVFFGKHCIQRGARWTGVNFKEGRVALTYLCDPATGIGQAYFYLLPWRMISLEKLNNPL